MNKFLTIKIPDFSNNDNKRFGVYHGYVQPNCKTVCKPGEKLFSRFFYVVKGEIIFDKNTADELVAHSGTIVYLPENVTYTSLWTNESGEYISINFSLNEFYVKLSDNICIAAFDENKSYYKMFNNALTIWENGRSGYKLELLSEIYRLLYNLFAKTTYEKIKNSHSTIYRGIFYLENHYLENITAKDLAKICHVSEDNFRRLFKKYKKMSPVTYRNYLRIQKAKDLIQSGEYNVTEAALAVNITDICYFHKLFKKYFECSPGSFISKL